MKGSRAAIRYAKSIFDLAVEKNILDDVSKDMNQLNAIIEENKEFQLMLKSPVINRDKKILILNQIFESSFNKLSLDFLRLITKNNRENLFSLISKEFGFLYKKHKNIIDVEISSATKLDESTIKSILTKIEKDYKGDFNVVENINKELIGGFLVKVGDYQIDSTVLNKFRKLKQTLLS